MNRNSISILVITTLLSSGSAAAAPTNVGTPGAKFEQLPEIQCGRLNCETIVSGERAASMVAPATASPYPVMVASPGAQRYYWQGAGYPTCQNLKTIPAPTSVAPYEYIKAESIPVPLGSTHANLLASAEVNISGGPTGSGGVYAKLQIKRSDTTEWINSSTGFVYGILGDPDSVSLWGSSDFFELEDLANLENGTGTPDAIDLRVVVYPLYTSGFVPGYSRVCKGRLFLTF